jgi:hypothetical protein
LVYFLVIDFEELEGVDLAGVSPGAEHLKVRSCQVTEKSFRHLGATGISGADKENFFLHDD